MIAEERETTLAYTAGDADVHITSCIRKDITAMSKKKAFTLVKSGKYADGTEWAEFTIPRDKFDIARSAKSTRTMTEQQKSELAERMRVNRKEQNA